METLLVGIDHAPPAPMQIGTPEAGDFRGYEVDLMAGIGRRLDAAIEYRRAYWSLITEELSNGKLDLVCSAATITSERARRVNFSKPA